MQGAESLAGGAAGGRLAPRGGGEAWRAERLELRRQMQMHLNSAFDEIKNYRVYSLYILC